jgi:hypothetical protein
VGADFSSFFEASHAEFLSSGGARVVPIDYKMDERDLEKILK